MTEIIGQKHALQQFQKAFRNQRLPNSYLLVGERGIGKSLVVLWLAKLLNCLHPSEEEPCLRCRNCNQLEHGNFLDYWQVQSEKTTIKIDQIRELHKNIHFAPPEKQWRIVFIKNAEEMTVEASNAFLKILEEPPQRHLMILSTSHSSQLLPTLVSRCQRIGFSSLSSEEMLPRLMSHFEITREEALLLAKLSGGSFGKAFQIQEALSSVEGGLRSLWSLMPSLQHPILGDKIALQLAEKWTGLDSFLALFLLRTWFRDLLFLSQQLSPSTLIHVEHIDFLTQHAQGLSEDGIYSCIRSLERAEYALKQNAVPLLTFESLFLKMKQTCSPIDLSK